MPIRIDGSTNRIIFNDSTFIDTANFPSENMPAGTRMFFMQTSAPTGWTKITTNNNLAMRVVSGTAGINTSGLDFTSCLMARTPTGGIGVSVNDHNNVILTTTTPSFAIQNTVAPTPSVSSLTFGNSSGTETIPINFTQHNGGNFATGTSTPSIPWINIGETYPGFPSHTHSVDNVDFNLELFFANGLSGSGSTSRQHFITTGFTKNYTNENTGNTSLYDSGHIHGPESLSISTDHSHSINISAHNHAQVNVNLSAHNHNTLWYGEEINFTNGNHTHGITISGHSHSWTGTHSASGSFTGDEMIFNIKYVDVIIAQKN